MKDYRTRGLAAFKVLNLKSDTQVFPSGRQTGQPAGGGGDGFTRAERRAWALENRPQSANRPQPPAGGGGKKNPPAGPLRLKGPQKPPTAPKGPKLPVPDPEDF